MMKKYLKIIIPIIIILALGIGFIILKKLQKNSSENGQTAVSLAEVGDDPIKKGKFLSNGYCEGEEKPKLTHLPMKENDFTFIIPYGMMIDDHITPIDHQYFQPTVFKSKPDTYPVYAMADSKLVDIGKRSNPNNDYEYRLVFSMSCKLLYYYDLVTVLTPELEKELAGKDYARTNITVKAGQQIGWIGGRTLDFAVWDTDVKLNYINPRTYDAEPWKIHTADPLNYYTEELKNTALDRYLGKAEPVSGKIDHDIDGKLIGSWFLEGQGGYAKTNERDMDAHKRHFSFSPDHIDPSAWTFSIGDYEGRTGQFGVKDNGPSPREIGVKDGIVKYELVQLKWVDEKGNFWDSLSPAKELKRKDIDNWVMGTALVQLTEDRKLKLETFPKKKASEVTGFTEKAKVYTR